MNTEENNQAVVVDTTNNEGEGETNLDTISISKSEYEKLNQTLGSLKREIKDYKKSKDETQETSKKNDKPDEIVRTLERVEKMALRQANITHEDDVELAKNTAKKWNLDLEDVLLDPDFKMKLERQQSERDNLNATSKVKGSGGQSQAKLTPEYWAQKKGGPPSAEELPDKVARRKIIRAMMSDNTPSKKFYND